MVEYTTEHESFLFRSQMSCMRPAILRETNKKGLPLHTDHKFYEDMESDLDHVNIPVPE